MKVTIEFEDLEEAKPCLEAGAMASLIWDWCSLLRNRVKHGDGRDTSWEQVREEFLGLMNESGVTLELP